MYKMQEMIDRLFGQTETRHVAQQPTELTLARERSLAEQAMKIEALRKARIARDATKH
jgi:septum formation topological specificity factor MinE